MGSQSAGMGVRRSISLPPGDLLGRVYQLLPQARLLVLVCSLEEGLLWGPVTIEGGGRRLVAATRLEVVAVSGQLLQAVVRHVGLASRLLGWEWDRGPRLDGWREMAGVEEVVEPNQARLHANHIFAAIGGEVNGKRRSLGEAGGEESLVRAVSKLEVVDLSNSDLSSAQLTHLLASLSASSKLKRLSLASLPLSSLPPLLISCSLLQLEEVDLSCTDLTEEQLLALLDPQSFPGNPNNLGNPCNLGNPGNPQSFPGNLRRLLLSYSDLSSIPPPTLALACTALQDVHLRDCLLTNQQLEALLAKVSHGHRLKVLNLAENDLSLVEERVLAEAVVALEEVDLTATSLTVAQVEEVLRAVLHSEFHSPLWRLYLPKLQDEVDENLVEEAGEAIIFLHWEEEEAVAAVQDLPG